EIDTRIRANVIQALEEGDFESLPPEPFLRGLIRSYSNYLGVDSEKMLELYVADFTPAAPSSPPPRGTPPKKSANPAPPPQSVPEPIPARAPLSPKNAAMASPGLPQPTATELAPVPPPPLPPETLAPPEKLEPSAPPADTTAAPTFQAHITRRGIPLPVVALIVLAAILACIAGTLLLATQIVPAIVSSASSATQTPTRAAATPAATLPPGAPPTQIPTLAVTAEPFATFPGNPTATLPTAPRRTPAASTGLNLNVDVTQTIRIDVGVDGVLVFTGPLEPGAAQTWTAKNTLYVRVENPQGATLSVNNDSKWFGARNFAERTVLERMLTINDKGATISVPPTAPAGTPVAIPPTAPSPTLTPFS
ncbi:MAG TPA: helix-turn-helix domain-containing protein, partial [Anaerolineae bacterium]